MTRSRYRKRPGQAVSAVRLALDTDGFLYRKWGAEQRCRAGDWLVDNDGDCYSVAAESFAATYEELSPGRYLKSAPVWAELAREGGEVSTREGVTRYAAGDYLVSNAPDGGDAYAVPRARFEAMYAPDEPSGGDTAGGGAPDGAAADGGAA